MINNTSNDPSALIRRLILAFVVQFSLKRLTCMAIANTYHQYKLLYEYFYACKISKKYVTSDFDPRRAKDRTNPLQHAKGNQLLMVINRNGTENLVSVRQRAPVRIVAVFHLGFHFTCCAMDQPDPRSV